MGASFGGSYLVYCHINKINGKKYIGITKRSPEIRWGNGKNYKGCLKFNCAIEKYGWNNFDHEIIASGLNKQEAENFEKLLIDKLHTTESAFGYNISFGGTVMENRKHTEESKKKMSENHRREDLGNNPRAKKVICENKTFSCIAECANFYNIKHSTMRAWLNGTNPMPKQWMEKGLNYLDAPIEHSVKSGPYYFKSGGDNVKAKKVMCEGIVYGSIAECAAFYNINPQTMRSWFWKNGNKMPLCFQEKGLKLLT